MGRDERRSRRWRARMSAFQISTSPVAEERRAARRHASGRPEELGLGRQRDGGMPARNCPQLLETVVSVDHDPARARPRRARSSTCARAGRSPTGTSGFGRTSVRGRSREPSPAARTIAGSTVWSVRQSWWSRRLVVGKTPMEVRRLAALALLLAGPAVASGCGTDAVDVDGCRQIEEARCRQAPACGIPSRPARTSRAEPTSTRACATTTTRACTGWPSPIRAQRPSARASPPSRPTRRRRTSAASSRRRRPTWPRAGGWSRPPPTTSDASGAPTEAAADVASE